MSGEEGNGRPRRELAYRIFATEFDNADFSFAESDEERAPNYVVTPTGARANRLFTVGVLTERERLESDQIRARIADPTGVFVVYAGQYQPDALAALEGLSVPSFVAITGKARTFQPEDSERVFTSIRPETITEVDADTRDRWIVETAGRTIDRIDAFETVLDEDPEANGLDPVSGIALAREHYGTTPAYLDALRETALDAARGVAGESGSVTEPTIDPGEQSDHEPGDSIGISLDGRTVATMAGSTDENATEDDEPVPEEPANSTVDPTGESEAETEAEAEAPNANPTTPDSTGVDPENETRIPAAETDSVPDDSTDEAFGGDDRFETEDESLDDTEPGNSVSIETDTDAPDSSTTDGEPSDPESGSEPTSEGTSDGPALTEEERATVEAEFDTGFTSGSEVDDAGEADIEPETGPIEESADNASTPETRTGTGSSPDPSSAGGDPNDTAPAEADNDAGSEAVDATEAVMDAMRDLDDGDGAGREAIVERASERGVSEATAEEALQEALMGGRCYEAGDDVFKAI